MVVDLLNPHVGIQTVLPQADAAHLPDIQRFAGVDNAPELSSIAAYKEAVGKNGFERSAVNAFTPQVSSDELLRPAVFNRHLNELEHKLQEFSADRDVRRFLREDLTPLRENRELLQAFLGMMVEG